jgi:beta-glucosidase
MDRRSFIASAAALTAASAFTPARAFAGSSSFPKGFFWGAATAGYQVEGNNTNADLWLLEHVKPATFVDPSGDADNSFELWETDLDLVKSLGLNAYRFSLEWSRIEPEQGQWSIAMLDHYKRIIDGCHTRGIQPFVTFNHVSTPRWFAALDGWRSSGSVDLFTRYCEQAAKHLAAGISHATTLNEPNLDAFLSHVLPLQVFANQQAALVSAAKASGVEKYFGGITIDAGDIRAITPNLLAAHKAGRAAIKAVRPDLPVGVSLAMADDQDAQIAQASRENSMRDAIRKDSYAAWLDAAKGDDFLGVQNYERAVWDAKGKLPPPAEARLNASGAEVYPASLAGAVRYAHQATGVPIIVTEHGVNADDDTLRAWLIPAALKELKAVMDEGVPVHGYLHWSLLDNFEWNQGYKPHFGLCSVDRQTFQRTPKPSAHILGKIAQANGLS